jgi:hypothetical protein
MVRNVISSSTTATLPLILAAQTLGEEYTDIWPYSSSKSLRLSRKVSTGVTQLDIGRHPNICLGPLSLDPLQHVAALFN